VRAALGDGAAVHNGHLGGRLHGGQAVRDDDDRAADRHAVQRLLHQRLALRIQRTRGLPARGARRPVGTPLPASPPSGRAPSKRWAISERQRPQRRGASGCPAARSSLAAALAASRPLHTPALASYLTAIFSSTNAQQAASLKFLKPCSSLYSVPSSTHSPVHRDRVCSLSTRHASETRRGTSALA